MAPHWRNVAILLIIAVSSSAVQAEQPNPPTIKTQYGELTGKVLITPRNKQCDAYLGVPYAEPPINDLRFQKPQPPKPWKLPRNAMQHGPKCLQLGNDAKNLTEQSEDCLVLNIFVPRSVPSEMLPVMVFIHGGAFVVGSAQDYGEEGSCENLASRGIILVVIQYRLFMYGFFSTGDEVAPGNYALWDQIEALKWVKDNIAKFGGDPNKVTIFGESAGAASVSYLTYTQEAQGLFHQTLTQSGSAYSNWARMTNVSVEASKKVAKSAKCADRVSSSTIKCLRDLKTIELQDAYNTAPGIFADPITNSYEVWSPILDGELYTSHVLSELDPERPTVIGVNSLEFPKPNGLDIPKADQILDQMLDRAFAHGSEVSKDVLGQLARFVYIDSKGDPNDRSFVYEQAMKMQSDQSFQAAVAHEASRKKAAGNPVWVYNFDYWSNNVFPPGYPFQKGATHGHELCYVFLHTHNVDIHLDCPDNYEGVNRQIADYFGEMWTNFAKTGDPSPNALVWPRFTSLSNASAMTIREKLTIEDHFYLEVTNFWYGLVPSIELALTGEERHDGSAVVQPASSLVVTCIISMVIMSKILHKC